MNEIGETPTLTGPDLSRTGEVSRTSGELKSTSEVEIVRLQSIYRAAETVMATDRFGPPPEDYAYVGYHDHMGALLAVLTSVDTGKIDEGYFFSRFLPRKDQPRGLRPDRGYEHWETTWAFRHGLHEVLRLFYNSRNAQNQEERLSYRQVEAQSEQYRRLVSATKKEGLQCLHSWAEENWQEVIGDLYKSNPRAGEKLIAGLERLMTR